MSRRLLLAVLVLLSGCYMRATSLATTVSAYHGRVCSELHSRPQCLRRIAAALECDANRELKRKALAACVEAKLED